VKQMEKLLLEIGAEEIPAGYIAPALHAMQVQLTEKLAAARIAHGAIRTFGTPRRLAVEIDDMAPKQRSESVEVMGPPARVGFDEAGKATVAAQKFAEKAGVPLSRLRRKVTDKGEYLVARKTERGLVTRSVLKKLLPQVVLAVPFPKSMRWADLDITFARPIHTIVALLGDKTIPFSVGNIKSGRNSCGHVFMAPGKVKLPQAGAYVDALRQAHVIADIDARRRLVVEEVTRAAAAAGGSVLADEALVDIVTNLVENPVATAGRFETQFLEVPKEVLITAMREHQKYFAVVDPAGQLMPAFIAINNTRTRDLALVATGHERVLRARLSDAQFFYRADLKVTAEERLEKLSGVLFQADLGSMRAKSGRIAAIGRYLVDAVGGDADLARQVERAATLCKTDLVSHVVVEFPKLQGVMGRVYAEVAGEPGDIPAAIEEHYRPARSGGALPETLTGAIVAIADKMDSICGCFSVGLAPTGAADPYALRRQAIGVVQILRAMNLSLSLRALIQFGLAQFGDKTTDRKGELADAIYGFFESRIEGIMSDQGFPKDSVAAVTAVSVDQIPDAWRRVEALDRIRAEADFGPLAVAFKRTVNILRKSDRDISRKADLPPDESLFEKPCEGALLQAYKAVKEKVAANVQGGDYEAALHHIATLKAPVDDFFEGVMVMAEDDAVRTNRLALLDRLADLFTNIADFSKITT
jgi:glycyl-tRNA synthetase beta chain